MSGLVALQARRRPTSSRRGRRVSTLTVELPSEESWVRKEINKSVSTVKCDEKFWFHGCGRRYNPATSKKDPFSPPSALVYEHKPVGKAALPFMQQGGGKEEKMMPFAILLLLLSLAAAAATTPLPLLLHGREEKPPFLSLLFPSSSSSVRMTNGAGEGGGRRGRRSISTEEGRKARRNSTCTLTHFHSIVSCFLSLNYFCQTAMTLSFLHQGIVNFPGGASKGKREHHHF